MTVQSVSSGSLVSRLWRGEVPFAQAFWTYGILYGTLLNLVATIAMLALVANDAPVALWLPVHLLPVPYNLWFVVGVWRAPDSPDWAKVPIAVWAIFLTFA